ncbi:MAG: Queuine tRNA-ribosyltransferase [Parcubacteria group bacterium ADurb.Bin159]|jgi:queuine tRNA-ribosyltransferase|nr:MAG: Queuine tRNA-ribosyltransferase [Parcubacteria group bacterium ADurb.Bin159]
MNYFKIIKKSKNSLARLGKISTLHGAVDTPNFMPIGSRGAVKLLTNKELKNSGAQIILANAYHLFLSPGIKVLKKAKGLHNFMNWPRAILTDSGGYQVFSLSKWRQISKEGVKFRDINSGQEIFLTPENIVEFQKNIGSDIIMVLDECTPYASDYLSTKRAVIRTTDWAIRAKKAFRKEEKKERRSLLFGIIQGGAYSDLRKISAQSIVDIGFDGYAIGGMMSPLEMKKVLPPILSILPETAPHYLMGLGNPSQLVWAISRGFDIFDCVLPTRNGRHGFFYVFKNSKEKFSLKKLLESNFYQTISIKNSIFKFDQKPIDKNCLCPTCQNYSRSYLHHLFRISDPLGQRLAVLHNLHFYFDLFKKIRKSI